VFRSEPRLVFLITEVDRFQVEVFGWQTRICCVQVLSNFPICFAAVFHSNRGRCLADVLPAEREDRFDASLRVLHVILSVLLVFATTVSNHNPFTSQHVVSIVC
jgi:hypothetical protein